MEVALHFASADAILNALSQHDLGRQVATRWSACKPVPASFAEFIDANCVQRGKPAEPQEQSGSALPLVHLAACNLEEGLGDLLTEQDLEAMRLMPAATLLTADEEVAWHLFGDDMLT